MLTPEEVDRRSRLLRTIPASGDRRPAKRDRFEVMVDPDGTLSPRELHRRATKARSKHFRELAKKRWHPVPECRRNV